MQMFLLFAQKHLSTQIKQNSFGLLEMCSRFFRSSKITQMKIAFLSRLFAQRFIELELNDEAHEVAEILLIFQVNELHTASLK